MLNLETLNNKDLNKEKAYLLSPFGLGDTAILCGLKSEIEKAYQVQVVLVVKESHEIVLKMYGIEEYEIINNRRFDSNSRILKDLAAATKFPQRGKLFVAHFDWSPKKNVLHIQDGNLFFGMLDFYKGFFGLPWECAFHYPKSFPKVLLADDDLMPKLRRNGISSPLNKICLIIPEVHSFSPLPLQYWKDIAEQAKLEGLMPITSVYLKEFEIPDVKNVSLSLEELITISMLSKKVIAMRSGLCDLIWQKGKDLYVVYPCIRTYYWARLKSIFPESEANEVIARMQ